MPFIQELVFKGHGPMDRGLRIYLKIFRRYAFRSLLLLTALFWLSAASMAAADHVEKHVLILHSYHPSLKWTAGIMEAMHNRLVSAHPDISIHVEYLDTKRNPSPEYFSSYVEGVLPQKLAGRRFDLVLTSDNDAFNFARRHRRDLFQDIPVVFCGVNGFNAEMIEGLGGITGVAEAPSFQKTVELALTLQPETREIIFIGETQSETGRRIDVDLHQFLKRFPAELGITFWNDRLLEDLEPMIGRLKQGQVLFLASVISTRSGQVLSYEESARHVREHAPVPIYGSWDFFLGQGIVGGLLTSSESQGDLAASLGLRVLAGESAEHIPVTTSDSNRYMFDFHELQRFNIPSGRLPAESTVINQPPSFYRLDKWQFWAGLTILLLLCASTFLLLRAIVQRRKSEVVLAERARLAVLGAEVGRVLTKGGDLRETLQVCASLLVLHTGTAFGRIWTVSEENPEILELQASAGLYTRIDGEHRIKRVGEFKVGIIGSERQPVLTNSVAGDPMFTDQEWIRREGIVGFAGYPLVVKDRLVGVTAFFSKQPINEAVQASISSVVDMIAVGIERHRAEVALQSALHDAEESHDNIDAILRSVVDGLIVTDPRNKVALINQSAERLLGVSFKQVCCQPLEIALQDMPFAGELCRFLAGEGDTSTLELLFPNLQGGNPLTIQAQTSPVYRRDGSSSGTVAILRDVTHERELDQVKNEFIATAAHELRTPLTTILGYAELLLSDMERSAFSVEQHNEFLGYIVEKSGELEKIIDELLDLGRIETGRIIILDKQRCEMVAIVKQIIKHYQQETSCHQFVVSCPVDCLDIEIDQAKMQRVFDNLLSNAVKYSPDGGSIHVEGRVVDGFLEVTIADQGIGMTREQAEKAFDKFYRADTSNTAVGGLGLGLTISKGIVEAHGGSLRIESQPGKGTRVAFRLPLLRSTEG